MLGNVSLAAHKLPNHQFISMYHLDVQLIYLIKNIWAFYASFGSKSVAQCIHPLIIPLYFLIFGSFYQSSDHTCLSYPSINTHVCQVCQFQRATRFSFTLFYMSCRTLRLSFALLFNRQSLKIRGCFFSMPLVMAASPKRKILGVIISTAA